MSGVISSGPPLLPERRLDVSTLPAGSNDHRAVIWWGNLMLLAIESMMFVLLIAAYFYLRQNFVAWPPPRAMRSPTMLHPYPSLPLAIVNLLVIVGSAYPMWRADIHAQRMDRDGIVKWSGIAVALGLLAAILRVFEFHTLWFKWDENAYASTVWAILAVHFMHLVVVTAEGALTWAWVWARGVDVKHSLDVRCSAVYWYWVSAVWVVLFAVVYIAPRLM